MSRVDSSNSDYYGSGSKYFFEVLNKKRMKTITLENGQKAKEADDQALMIDAMIRMEECKHILNTL